MREEYPNNLELMTAYFKPLPRWIDALQNDFPDDGKIQFSKWPWKIRNLQENDFAKNNYYIHFKTENIKILVERDRREIL